MIKTGRFLIRPPGTSIQSPGEVAKDELEVTIIMPPPPPGVYGAGWHRTTQATLATLSKYLEPHMSFLDFGSGTGIIAVAAWMLGAERVYAAEVDQKAVAFSNRVFELNGVEVEFVGPESYPPVDLCIANLGMKILNYKGKLHSTTLISVDGHGFSAMLGDEEGQATVEYVPDPYKDQDIPLLQPNWEGDPPGPVQLLGYFLGVDYKRVAWAVKDKVYYFRIGQSLRQFQGEVQGVMDVQFGLGKVVIGI